MNEQIEELTRLINGSFADKLVPSKPDKARRRFLSRSLKLSQLFGKTSLRRNSRRVQSSDFLLEKLSRALDALLRLLDHHFKIDMLRILERKLELYEMRNELVDGDRLVPEEIGRASCRERVSSEV